MANVFNNNELYELDIKIRQAKRLVATDEMQLLWNERSEYGRFCSGIYCMYLPYTEKVSRRINEINETVERLEQEQLELIRSLKKEFRKIKRLANDLAKMSKVMNVISIVGYRGQLITENKKLNKVANLLIQLKKEGKTQEIKELIHKKMWICKPIMNLVNIEDSHEILETMTGLVAVGDINEGQYLDLCENIRDLNK